MQDINIMAAVWLLGSLHIYSKAGSAAGRVGGQKPVRGRLAAPREGSWRKVERAGRGKAGSRPGSGNDSESI